MLGHAFGSIAALDWHIICEVLKFGLPESPGIKLIARKCTIQGYVVLGDSLIMFKHRFKQPALLAGCVRSSLRVMLHQRVNKRRLANACNQGLQLAHL